MIKLNLDALHVIALDAFEVAFLFVLRLEIRQSSRVEGHLVLQQQTLDEGIIPLAGES